MKKSTLNTPFATAILAHARLLLLSLFLGCLAMPLSAQRIACQHKVQKKETLFGITKMYGVTVDQLRDANPIMRTDDFVLKKGMILNIPESTQQAPATTNKVNTTVVDTKKESATSNAITVGVMLPLHNINGDGKRMMEYYRGMLLAIRDLQKEGINITVNAWNVPEGADIRTTLVDPKAAECNVIFGPLYTTQVPALANFCSTHNIPMVIPFSINGNDVQVCPQIHQVYQSPSVINDKTIEQFISNFASYHPVFIDCNDATSQKGSFTAGLRSELISKNIDYNITNLTSADDVFKRAFSTTKRNIVILNSARSPELGKVFKRLDAIRASNSNIKISMFGYNEWFMYYNVYKDKFRLYDTYIPSVYDYNPESAEFKRIEKLYSQYYKCEVQYALPRFAITGYDQAMCFIRGIKTYGKDFHGLASQKSYTHVQTPLLFERINNGGYQNRNFMLIHFK